jgi:hypothetical protein
MAALTHLFVTLYVLIYFCFCVKLFKQYSDTAVLLKMHINNEEVICLNCVQVQFILMLRGFFLHYS